MGNRLQKESKISIGGAFIPASTGQLQRKCACGNHTMVNVECEECAKKKGMLQRKLTIGASNDPLEQEADRVADQVISMPYSPVFNATPPRIQRFSSQTNEGLNTAPPTIDRVLASSGSPLDLTLQQDMEQRLGHDFSNVRIHKDAAAAESTSAVDAHAYTVGHHIAFSTGSYDTHTQEGRRLIAHELVHVIQQSGKTISSNSAITLGSATNRNKIEAEHFAIQLGHIELANQKIVHASSRTLQRQHNRESVNRIDVSIVLDDAQSSMAEGRGYAQIVLRVTSEEDAKEKLAALKEPIGTLYVISHSNRAGEVKFVSGIGTISWVKISVLGQKLKGALPPGKIPNLVDFRGCKIGESADQLGAFRRQFGAPATRGTNCWSFIQYSSPVWIGDDEITRESQVTIARRAMFDRALRQNINRLQAANGVSIANCLTGLGRGETALRHFNKVRSLYFRNGGKLVAGWASPEYNENWQRGSICNKDMTASTAPCKLVTATAPTSEKKSGAIEVNPPATSIASIADENLLEETST